MDPRQPVSTALAELPAGLCVSVLYGRACKYFIVYNLQLQVEPPTHAIATGVLRSTTGGT